VSTERFSACDCLLSRSKPDRFSQTCQVLEYRNIMTKPIVRALVVEDDLAWQDILSEILSDAGLAVETASSLEAASSLIRSHPHRMAVVDLSLDPEDPRNQDGLAALDAIRRQDPGCIAVLLTGFATVELAVSALKTYGAYTCLQKELFQRRHFREIVDKILASAPLASGSPAIPPFENSPQRGGELLESEPPQTAGQVLVTEDDAGWRSILFELLRDAGYPVRLCASYGEALGYLRREKFRLAVIDLALSADSDWSPEPDPAGLEGYRLLEETQAQGIPTIVVSGVSAPLEIERAYREKGVFAFLEKQAFDRHIFLKTVREAKARTRGEDELESLTGRELEILLLLAQGHTNPEIASQLFISVNTVKRHLKAIFQKLDIHTRAAAAAKAAGLTPRKDSEPKIG
jgi:DNA-binding NarL/FixJ family response regulator